MFNFGECTGKHTTSTVASVAVYVCVLCVFVRRNDTLFAPNRLNSTPFLFFLFTNISILPFNNNNRRTTSVSHFLVLIRTWQTRSVVTVSPPGYVRQRSNTSWLSSTRSFLTCPRCHRLWNRPPHQHHRPARRVVTRAVARAKARQACRQCFSP